ncbi:hypothetical protein [Streptomyces sp. H27-C3]|uniref:hypothetical protein n=1 Tax=Streptomyces sp. H27-C3 TaxID=3046305 RepID=UPI0024BA9899|nr:hypothetical protein [Streptomyces sp. H27-C3]MDJ0466139.1 hypothetical protein [Streptomyces sp. H27-C3]
MTKNDDIPAGESPAVPELRADLERYFAFLRDFSTETVDPVLSRMAGYAYGYAAQFSYSYGHQTSNAE